METLFPSAFEHSLNCFEYLGWAEVPNVRFIEMVFDKVTAQPRIEEGLLHEKNIEAYLDKDFGHANDSTRAGGLRLVLLEDYTEDGKRIKLSLPKEILRSILQHFSLPSPYLSTKPKIAARSAMVESRSEGGDRLLSFLTRDNFMTRETHALALTHNLQTSVTSSIMIGNPHFLKSFVPYIGERLDLVWNPSFLGLVLCQIDLNYAETWYSGIMMESFDVEGKTGHGDIFVHEDPADLRELDLPAMTKSVHALASDIARGERRAKNSQLRLERLADFNQRNQAARSPENSPEWDNNVREIKQHIQWQEDILRSMLYEYENLAKAATSQMSIVGREFSNAHQDLGF